MAAKKRVQKATPATLIPELVFNRDANSYKVSETGFCVGTILGAIDSAQKCGRNKPVLIANTAAAVHYVKFGASNVAAPTGLTDGIMIPAGSLVVLASGPNEYIRSDSASVGAYVGTEQILDDGDQQQPVFPNTNAANP